MADDGTPASDVLSGLAGEFVAAPDSVAREMVRGHRRALADAMSASEVSDAARRALAAGNKDLALQIFERAFVATAPTAVSIAEAWDDLARAHSPEMRKLVMTVGACGSPVELKRVIIANEDTLLTRSGVFRFWLTATMSESLVPEAADRWRFFSDVIAVCARDGVDRAFAGELFAAERFPETELDIEIGSEWASHSTTRKAIRAFVAAESKEQTLAVFRQYSSILCSHDADALFDHYEREMKDPAYLQARRLLLSRLYNVGPDAAFDRFDSPHEVVTRVIRQLWPDSSRPLETE
jgi:hypothetical protein